MHIDKQYLTKRVDDFATSRILVVGDIMLDQFIWGKVSRISPEAPVPVVEVDHETRMLGGAANVVSNIVASGGTVLLCGVVGDDRTGKEIIAKLEELGVRGNGIVVENDRPTTIKTRIIAHAQQVVRYDREKTSTLKLETIRHIVKFIEEEMGDLSAIIVSDYGKGVVSPELMDGIRTVISGRNVPVTVDPNVRNFPLYKGVTIITPNHSEAGQIANIEIGDERLLVEIGKKLLSDQNCKALLITRGADGMTLFEEDGSITHIKSVAKRVYDVTGAGDTVIAILTLGITAGLDLRASAYLSNLAAGLVVGEVGTSTVKIDDLRNLIASHFS
jgi:rfaE bifunctional protein kinase chain/domain